MLNGMVAGAVGVLGDHARDRRELPQRDTALTPPKLVRALAKARLASSTSPPRAPRPASLSASPRLPDWRSALADINIGYAQGISC